MTEATEKKLISLLNDIESNTSSTSSSVSNLEDKMDHIIKELKALTKAMRR